MRKQNRKELDVLIIGGGILGCFAARNLEKWNLSVLLAEEKEDVCTGITRANSAIVYSGYDNKAGSLKAKMTVRANRTFQQLCEELEVPFCRCGSLAVAEGPEGEAILKKKYRNGQENGVPGLCLISGEEARQMEPQLSKQVTMALYAPTTGTVNPWQLGIAAYENALENGCECWLNTKVIGIKQEENGYLTECERSIPGKKGGLPEKRIEQVYSKVVLNCAGIQADQMQELLFEPSVRLTLDGAVYLVMDRRMKNPEHVIFQECEKKGKGITTVPSPEGNLLVASERCPMGEQPFFVDPEVLLETQQKMAQLLPDVDGTQIIRSFGAVRPNPQEVMPMLQEDGSMTYEMTGKSIGSFVIAHPAPGFYSLIGIKTPGITCANELGTYLAEQTAEYLHAEENSAFVPFRKGIPAVRHMDWKERATWAAKDSDYGEIVCQCEGITKAEIKEAIRRGAVTADGVKRRVGSGMGICQGSRCQRKIEDLLRQQ